MTNFVFWSLQLVLSQKINLFSAVNAIESKNYIRLQYENDLFLGQDQNYTQGIVFELVSEKLEINPISSLFITSTKTEKKYGIALEHSAYTPYNYAAKEIQYGDRPFAGVFTLNSFLMEIDTVQKSKISQQLSIGVLGTLAFAKEVQIGIHKVTKNSIPGGWKNQIQNDLALNYKMDYQRQVLTSLWFSVFANASLRVGTISNKVELGTALILGRYEPLFKQITQQNSKQKRSSKKFLFYVYSQPSISIIGYDATLQGGLFNKTNSYILNQKQVQRAVFQLNSGIVFQMKKYSFEFSQSSVSKEFKSGKIALWGGIKFAKIF
jgi:lipid A 3-O-deacylase